MSGEICSVEERGLRGSGESDLLCERLKRCLKSGVASPSSDHAIQQSSEIGDKSEHTANVVVRGIFGGELISLTVDILYASREVRRSAPKSYFL